MTERKPTIKDVRGGAAPAGQEWCPVCGRAMVWDDANRRSGNREWICPRCLSLHEGVVSGALHDLVSDLVPMRDNEERHAMLVQALVAGHLERAAKRRNLPSPALTPFAQAPARPK